MPASGNSATDDRELIITRTFAAPRDLVWQMFTDMRHMQQWMGPVEFPAASMEGDFRVGGKWRGVLKASDGSGRELGQGGEFREIRAPQRLAYTFKWDDRHNDPGFETLVTIDLEEEDDDVTLMTFRQSPFNTVQNRDGHVKGWNSAFDRLDQYLAREGM
ncbi:MAG TPA: SRPBCC domain-containing protein [Rhizomicrobium sp.]|jgi:uncharacterized protein YndB with AHSA1/START domain|nr:SRPBCC domain-containing protein [Rhizomicrobium sp.]